MVPQVAHVDDDPHERWLVKALLEAEGHYHVHGFATTARFLAALAHLDPALAILDLMVERDDSGLMAYEQLRVLRPAVAVIFLTSLGPAVSPYFGPHQGDAPIVLRKPVAPATLLETVSLLV